MADVKPEKKSEDISSSKEMKVKNVSNKTLNLSTGQLEPDKVGKCTFAEFQLLGDRVEKV